MTDSQLEPEKLLQKSLISGVDIGVLITNQEDMIEWANDYFCKLLNISFDEIKGESTFSLLDIDPLHPERNSFRLKLKKDDGEEIWLTCLQAVEENKHTVRYFVDISDLQRRQTLRLAVSSGLEHSRMDPNTGVLNRRTIIQELNNEISRSRRYGNPLSVILLEYSMPGNGETGTEIEQKIASGINSALRWVDIIGSLNGGGFLIVLPESDMAGVEQAWNKISVELQKQLPNQVFKVSYSDWQQDNNADEFIARLGDSLEAAKVA